MYWHADLAPEKLSFCRLINSESWNSVKKFA